MTRARAAFLVGLALVLAAASANGQPTARAELKERAREAYARGVRAHDAGDFRGAASAFAQADALAPSPVALQAALDATVEADDPVLGAELLERSTRASPTPALAASIDTARRKLGGRAGKVRVACPEGSTCSTEIDGRAVEDPTWVSVGRHVVVVRVDGEANEHAIEVRAGETFVLSPMSPSAAAKEGPVPVIPVVPAPHGAADAEQRSRARAPRVEGASRGLPPIVVLAGAAITVALGAAAGTAGYLAGEKHDDFVRARCRDGPGPGCTGLRDEGRQLVLATNALLAGMAVSAIATAVIAIAFTDWASSSTRAQRTAGTASYRLHVGPGLTIGF